MAVIHHSLNCLEYMQCASRWKGVWILPVAAQRPLSLAAVSGLTHFLCTTLSSCQGYLQTARSWEALSSRLSPSRCACEDVLCKMGPWYDLTGVATLNKTFSLEHIFAMTYHWALLHKLHSSGVFVFLIASSRNSVKWQSVKKCVGTDVTLPCWLRYTCIWIHIWSICTTSKSSVNVSFYCHRCFSNI